MFLNLFLNIIISIWIILLLLLLLLLLLFKTSTTVVVIHLTGHFYVVCNCTLYKVLRYYSFFFFQRRKVCFRHLVLVQSLRLDRPGCTILFGLRWNFKIVATYYCCVRYVRKNFIRLNFTFFQRTTNRFIIFFFFFIYNLYTS